MQFLPKINRGGCGHDDLKSIFTGVAGARNEQIAGRGTVKRLHHRDDICGIGQEVADDAARLRALHCNHRDIISGRELDLECSLQAQRLQPDEILLGGTRIDHQPVMRRR